MRRRVFVGSALAGVGLTGASASPQESPERVGNVAPMPAR